MKGMLAGGSVVMKAFEEKTKMEPPPTGTKAKSEGAG